MRREQMRLYAEEGGRRVITNALCLTEGINVPVIDLVSFMDSGSTVDIVQSVGRTLRRSPGKIKAMRSCHCMSRTRRGRAMMTPWSTATRISSRSEWCLPRWLRATIL